MKVKYGYFDEIVNVNHFGFRCNLLNKKLFESLLIYDVAFKTLYGAKLHYILFFIK